MAPKTNRSLLDPTVLARMGGLEFVARLLVEGGHVGIHRSPFKGSSVEFVEHRPYTPGDEIRHIDWRAYGKTGEYYIKEFEEETNLSADLIVDASGSMAYAGRTLSKFAYARQLAVVLAYLLLSQRDAVGLATYDTLVRDRWAPSTHRYALSEIATRLQNRRPGREGRVTSMFEGLLAQLKRRSQVLLITDGYADLSEWEVVFRRLRTAHHETLVFQVVAPEEEEFPFTQPTEFRSLETTNRMLVDPHRLRTAYLERYRQFQAEFSQLCATLGVEHLKLRTDTPYQTAVGQFLEARRIHKA